MATLSQYQARRQALCEHMMDNSVAVLTSASVLHRNNDTEFPYRQESYFYYLTGMEDPDIVAVFIKHQGQLTFVIFCQPRNEMVEKWVGPRMGLKEAKESYGADEVFPMEQFQEKFSDSLRNMSTIYYLVHAIPSFDKQLFKIIENLRHQTRSGIECPFRFIDLRVLLSELRLIKQTEEISCIQKACDISVDAHIQTMKQCQEGLYEYELEAILLYEFYRRGSRYPAYPSIVAGGKNACILHYTKNNAPLNQNDLVLIDAGAEYEGYASDITRTFPVNGKFKKEQQAIYELVLASQTAAIELIRPGVKWSDIQKEIIKILVTGLIDLKILNGNLETLIEEKAYSPFYMHNSGHWLGLDVHDVGDYKVNHEWRDLMPGMVLTVEPGLYLSHDNFSIPEKYRGIGIRIEDDVWVTEKGNKVLTQHLPKSVEEIEKIMKK